MTQDPILSTDGRLWIDPTDGRTVPVVRGGADDAPAVDAPEAPEAPTGAETAPAAEPGHSFESIDDAVAALKETRAEAAQRRVEAKELSGKVERYETALAGYKSEEVDYLLEMFHDLSDPKAQKRAAKELSEIAARVLENEGAPTRPTGEEDPDEKPLTKKEWERLQGERDQSVASEQALKQLESEATTAGYPPDSPGYTVLLSALMEPEVAGDMDKAVERVKAYEVSVVEKYRQDVQGNGERWPSPAATAPSAPGDPDSGIKPGWGNARKASMALLKARVGQT